MSGENTEAVTHRRKRVQRIKKYIIRMILFLILLPTALCVALFIRIYRMNRVLIELTDTLEILTEESAAQQETLRELMESMRTTGEGSQAESEAPLEFTGYELTVPETSEQLNAVEASGTSESGETTVHKVYLTFDDGPSANTEKILDILDDYGVKATFFVVGKEEEIAREALVQIVERGHTLGMHSYSHKYSEIYSSEEYFAADFEKLQSYLKEITGVTCDIYRFPGGSSNTVSKMDMHVFMDYLDSKGVRFYDWNVSSGDASRTQLSVNQLVKNATEGIEQRETSVILMHDAVGKRTTVEALPIIIERILAMEDTVILPIAEDTALIQHIQNDNNN